MFLVHKVFLASTYPKDELVETMNRFFACLVLCASLSASAQDDNCTVLGIQDLTQMVFELQAEIDSLKGSSMTRDSVAEIAFGVAWLGELAGANFSGADLSKANLHGADLDDADLTSADLSDANLSGASFWCLEGCPGSLPPGYVCIYHLCSAGFTSSTYGYKIVTE